MTKKKALIVTKAGGHSIQALGVKEKLEDRKVIVLTDTKDPRDYGVKTYRTKRLRNLKEGFSPLSILKNIFKSLKVILKENPDEIYCCGANNSLFAGFWGKLFWKKVVAIEANNRIKSPSKTPKILSWFCDKVWVPHQELKGKYRGKAVKKKMIHPFAENFEKFRSKNKEFDLLVVPSSVDNIGGKNVLKGLEHEELLKKIGKTKKIVTRGGITSWEAAHLADEVIVIPVKKSHENHQQHFAEWLEKKFDNIKVEKNIEKYVEA